ncbi:MAG TPA: hypothetical protein VGE52_00395 [Pirellulales bacterium]
MRIHHNTLLAAAVAGWTVAAAPAAFAQAPGYAPYPAYGAAPYPAQYPGALYPAAPYGAAPYAAGQYGPPMMAQAGQYAPAGYPAAPSAAVGYAPAGGCDSGCTPAPTCGAATEPKCASDEKCGPHCEGCVICDPCHEPLWRASAGVIFLQRDNPTALVTGIDAGNAGNVQTTQNIDFDPQAGADFLLSRRIGKRFGVEARYFGFNHWSETNLFTADAAGNAVSPFLAGGADDQISTNEKSLLHSAEFNVRGSFLDTPLWTASALSGFRYIYLQDEITLTGITAGDDTQSTRTRASNNLFGWQLGADLNRAIGEAGQIGVYGKGGLFLGRLNQHTTQTVGGVGVNDVAFTGDALSSVIEVGANGRINVTRWLAVRGGYQVVAINGVALAAEQLPFLAGGPPANGLDNNGNMVLWGPTAGLDIIW